jgi:hypothetical protein
MKWGHCENNSVTDMETAVLLNILNFIWHGQSHFKNRLQQCCNIAEQFCWAAPVKIWRIRYLPDSYPVFSSFFLLSLDSCRFVGEGRPLWQEVGSVLYSCCSVLPVQSLLGLSPTGIMIIFYCHKFGTLPTWRTRFLYLFTPSSSSFTTNSQSAVCLGVGLPSGAHDQIFVFCLMIAVFLM